MNHNQPSIEYDKRNALFFVEHEGDWVYFKTKESAQKFINKEYGVNSIMRAIKQHGDVRYSTKLISVNVPIEYGHMTWDVVGTYNIVTKEFIPELVGSYSVGQFMSENNINPDAFQAKLTTMVKKGLK